MVRSQTLFIPGCLAKLKRAEEHRKALHAELVAWKRKDAYSADGHCSADFTRHSLVVRLREPLPAERLSLIAGDCVHALRSALDHLVYGIAAVTTQTNPPPNYRKLQFPIANNESAFNNAIDRGQLSGLTDATIAEIRSVQPFIRTHSSVPPLLALLREFDDSDKHRLLNVVSSGQLQADFHNRIPIPAKSSVTIEFKEGPIEDGTEALVVTTEIPQPDLLLDVTMQFAVAIMHEPGPSKVELSGLWALVSMLRNEVHLVVDRVVHTIAA